MRSDVRSCTRQNLAPLYIKCSPQHSPSSSHCHESSKVFFATRRLFSHAISSDAEDRLFNKANIGAVRVDNAMVRRLRKCVVYEVCVAGIDRAFLAFLAVEGFSSMRAVGQPLGALYSYALIASDVYATELHLRPLADETTIVLPFRFKCYSQRAAGDLSDISSCTTRSTTSLVCPPHSTGVPPTFISQHQRCAYHSFARRKAARSPYLHSALHYSAPPGLNISVMPGSQGQFSGSAPSSSSHQTSPAPFGHPLRLTVAANGAAASREQSQLAAFVLPPGSSAAHNASLQPLGVFKAAFEPVIRSRRRSGPVAAPLPAPNLPPHVQPVTAAAAVPQPSARVAPAVAPPQPS